MDGSFDIRIPVLPSIIDSISPPSLTPITGLPQAMNSSCVIPASSSTGIYIPAWDWDISSSLFSSDTLPRNSIFSMLFTFIYSCTHDAKGPPEVIINFLLGICSNAFTIRSILFRGSSLACERK